MNKSKSTNSNESIDKFILQRYDIIRKIGEGAYGIVWKALDKTSHHLIALKKIFGAFRNSTDAQRTFREITFLRQLKGHPQVVDLLAVYRAQNNLDLYVVFELLESDVYATIRANILLDVHKKYISFQLISAVKYLHTRKLIHRDLKPSNLLINSDSRVKLCDFGLARTLSEGNNAQEVLTEYVSTRWYRAPELIIGSNHYNEGADMWAIGCIVAELYLGKPIFPGSSSVDQLEKVVALTGPPTSEDIQSMQSEFAETMISNLQYTQPRFTLSEKLPTADSNTIDFISKLLVFNPTKRISIFEAIEHPFVHDFRNQEFEFNEITPIQISLKDSKRYQTRHYRNKLYKEIESKICSEQSGIMEKSSVKT